MSEIIQRELAIQKIEELAGKQLSKANVNCISVNAGEVIDCLLELPTVDEKEIIRKPFERVIVQLSEQMPIQFNGFGKTLITVEDVIKILKEECGINE